MRLFYDPDIATGSDTFTLNEEESKHISRVLRMKEGDIIGILNGKGSFFQAAITKSGKHCDVAILSSQERAKPSCEIHIAVAPTKNSDRIEWLVEKATEIGISELSLIRTSNTERTKQNTERLHKKAVSAMKQSGRWHLPVINELCTFETFVTNHPQGLIAHCYDNEKLPFDEAFRPQSCPILIGPEGDFTTEELQLALDQGYKTISLGANRLRTETAALYACIHAKILCP